MSSKVLLILVDGMRPDAVLNNPRLKAYYEDSLHDFAAQTTFPPVTLPCHMSLFHSVGSERHGITTNTFVPQNHPVRGLVETLHDAGKTTAFFYTWAELRDLCTPGECLSFSWFMKPGQLPYPEVEHRATAACKAYIDEFAPDFAFLYLGATDEIGHDVGWMTKAYEDEVDNATSCILDITATLPKEYAVIVTADHGGHGRNHGDDVPEDMTIPILYRGDEFKPGVGRGFNIKDIAPTIAKLLGVAPDRNWEGTSRL